MSRSLTLDDLHAIRHMLRAGFRFTQIARELNLAVGTISRIASDRKLRRHKHVAEIDLPADDPPPDYVAANLRRCPGCGAMVYLWPCLACRMIGQARRLPSSFNAKPQAPASYEVAAENTVAYGSPLNDIVPIEEVRHTHDHEPRS